MGKPSAGDDEHQTKGEHRDPPRPEEPAPAVIRLARPVRSVAVDTLLALALLYTVYLAREFLLPLALAGLLAVIISPLIRFAKRRLRIPRSVSSAIVLVLLLGATAGGLLILSGPALRWLEEVPQILRDIEYEVRHIESRMDDMKAASKQVEQLASMEGPDAPEDGVVTVRVERPSFVDAAVNQTRGVIVLFALTIALLYFLLVSGDTFLRKLVDVIPSPHDKLRAVETVFEIQERISSYIVTITAINAGLGVATGVAMFLLGLPNALLWGVMAATFNYIPYLGAIVGSFVVSLVAMSATGEVEAAILAGGVYWGLTVIEGSLVTPLILGRRMTINPAVLFVGILFWGWVWGIPGALLAAPMLVAFKIVFDATTTLRSLGELMGR